MIDEQCHQPLAAHLVRLVETPDERAVEVENPKTSPLSSSGTTSSERETGSQAIWPGNSWTSGTSTVAARAAAVPQTPFPSGIRTQAGLP